MNKGALNATIVTIIIVIIICAIVLFPQKYKPYYCENSSKEYDCETVTKHYGLPNGECINNKYGNKRCNTGWVRKGLLGGAT